MRKVLMVIIMALLLLGVSGCKSVPTAREELSPVDVVNASKIVLAINAYDTMNLNNALCDNMTLEDTKKQIGKYQWPEGLSDEEEIAAWKLVVIKDGEADLVPEAQQALQIVARYAYSIAYAINMNDIMYTCWMIEPDTTLEDAKKSIKAPEEQYGIFLWPEGLSNEEERAAWKLIVIDDWSWVAALTPEAQQALQEGIKYESDQVKNADAIMIATGINTYNALHKPDLLPDSMTLSEVKETLCENFWPSFLTDMEASEAWKLIEIKDGVAKVKESE